jgi:hypothetical protein
MCIDRFWPAIRDPYFDEVLRIVRDRQAESPGRPLVLALGSSRTKMALRAERLNHPQDVTAPVVVNVAQRGAGAIQQLTTLERFLSRGVRPRLVFVEIMPMGLSARGGRSMEESFNSVTRFSAAEVADAWRYCSRPLEFCYPWLRTRVWPCQRFNFEMRAALAIDTAEGRQPRYVSSDGWGWLTGPERLPREQVEAETRDALAGFQDALAQAAVAPGTVQIFRDIVELCRREQMAVVFVVPPEGSAFRNFAPDVALRQAAAVHQLARELTVPLVDARTWIDDDRFSDGHHALPPGADQYTERFGREVLGRYRPLLRDWSGPFVARAGT